MTRLLATIEFATTWPVALIVALGVLALVAVGWLCRLERKLVAWPTGLALVLIRGALIVLVVAALFEPVHVVTRRYTELPSVAVLVDVSASMATPLAHLSDGEKLAVADALGDLPATARPLRLDLQLALLDRAMEDVRAQLGWLGDSAAQTPRGAIAPERLEQVMARGDELAAALKQVAGSGQGWQTRVDDNVRRESVDAATRLESQVLVPLRKLAKLAAESGDTGTLAPARRGELARLLELGTGGFDALAPDLLRLSDQLDEAFAAALDPGSRAALERVGRLSRQVLAQRLAEARSGSWVAGLLAQGPEQPARAIVRTYVFASKADEQSGAQQRAATQPGAGVGPAAASRPAGSQPADAPFDAQVTDVTAAIQQALADVGQAALAGVVVISDGRHNRPGSNPEQAVRAVVGKQAVLHTVLVGGRQAPPDAAVVELSAPTSVFFKDKVDIQATIKLDGLAGRKARVRLEQDGRILAEQVLTPDRNEQRTPVTLTCQPDKVGRQRFEVVVENQAGEVNLQNNSSAVLVDVVKDACHVLVADREPRWEYRYLRNLLIRDKQIKLQFVLTDPLTIDKAPVRPPLPAKPGNTNPEADRLPETEADWLGFDVIILGDLSARQLPRATQETLVKFVSERGGTLILIAGPGAMPDGFVGQPLESILPVASMVAPGQARAVAGQSQLFRLALTPEGESSTMMQLGGDATTSARVWAGLPPHHWLSPYRIARGAATVLAWADFAADRTTRPATEDPASIVQQQKRNAAITWQGVGLGRVMFLGFDSTWRLRLRVGDTLHHRLWSQIMRWATADRLTSGWKHVKFGTDQPIYQSGEPVVVKARLTNPDFSPRTEALLAVKVTQGAQPVATVWLTATPNVPGQYEARVAGLKAGEYQLALDGAVLNSLRDPLNAAETVESLRTSVQVRAGLTAEQAELTPNAAAMAQWAGLGGGLALGPGSAVALKDAIQPQPIHIDYAVRSALWNTWGGLLLFAALITAEWVLRKRSGLA